MNINFKTGAILFAIAFGGSIAAIWAIGEMHKRNQKAAAKPTEKPAGDEASN